jgi:predicted transposase YbfD/YdcC
MGTLWEALEGLPDRRTRKGRRYELASIVALSLAAMLSGANDLMAIFRFGRRLTPKGLEMLGIKRRKAPCHATYHYVFQSIAASDLERALGRLVAAGPPGHIAIDGKRLRGSRQGETSPGVHMLQAFSTRLQACIGSLAVPPDSGEAVEAIALLKSLDLSQAIVTGDAAFSFADLAQTVRDRGGHYFLFVKGNQPELQAELAHSFGDDSPLTARQPSRPRHSAHRSA